MDVITCTMLINQGLLRVATTKNGSHQPAMLVSKSVTAKLYDIIRGHCMTSIKAFHQGTDHQVPAIHHDKEQKFQRG